MDQNPDTEDRDLMDDVADDFFPERENDERPDREPSFETWPPMKLLVIGGAGILILSIIASIIFGGGGDVSSDDLNRIASRVDQLEKRLAVIDKTESRIAKIESRANGLGKSVADTKKTNRVLARKVERLTKRLSALRKEMASKRAKPKAKIAVKKAVEKKAPEVAGGTYHRIIAGDSLYRIAQKYNLSVEELCRLNKITPKHVISPGQKLLVSKP
jgi:LysM repeat protein